MIYKIMILVFKIRIWALKRKKEKLERLINENCNMRAGI